MDEYQARYDKNTNVHQLMYIPTGEQLFIHTYFVTNDTLSLAADILIIVYLTRYYRFIFSLSNALRYKQSSRR